jgi:hypothetical protein
MPVLRLPLLKLVHINHLAAKIIGRIREMTLMRGHGAKIYQRCLYLFNAFFAIISISPYSIIIYNAGQMFLST